MIRDANQFRNGRVVSDSLAGGDIRALRKSRGLTISQLAAAVGRSVGWLSQVERGRTTPSVHDLGLIAGQLGVSISFFFRSASRRPEERGHVLRRADRTSIGSPQTGLTEELLSPSLNGQFQMIRSVFQPRTSSGGLKPARKSEDGGVVISGRITLWIGDLKVDLDEGDSFHFAEREYGWRNDHDQPAEILWIISPPIY